MSAENELIDRDQQQPTICVQCQDGDHMWCARGLCGCPCNEPEFTGEGE